ncbi:MAG TPA: hypothetical protein VNO14_05960, partial [Blastocatellia bacterium]|nr:hypothetical protein [Blastocatellia bacterium]
MAGVKTISREAIPRALEKAERYRLLNEPADAESICLDILQIDPENQQAIIMLLLAMTDQFDRRLPENRPRELLTRLKGEYERAYYAGIICERRARAHLSQGFPGCGFAAHDGLREAMSWYEKAEAVRPPGNDDAILRWNACARTIVSHHLQ